MHESIYTPVPLPWQQEQWQLLMQNQRAQRLSHALLFTGPKGVGKAQFAKALAMALYCQQANAQYQACLQCSQCQLLLNDTHPDYFYIHPEETSRIIKIEQVRQLVSELQMTSQQGGWKIVIIDRAEQLNTAAANALLKTLEEPRQNSLLILLNEQISQVLATLRSRCQIYKFPAVKTDQASTWLKQNCEASNIEELLFFAPGAPLLAKHFTEANFAEHRQHWLAQFQALLTQKIDPLMIAKQCSDDEPARVLWYWQLLVTAMIQTLATTVTRQDLPENIQAIIQRGIALFTADELLERWQHLLKAHQQLMMQSSSNKQLLLESVFIQWIK